MTAIEFEKGGEKEMSLIDLIKNSKIYFVNEWNFNHEDEPESPID
jgi:urease beta subunit